MLVPAGITLADLHPVILKAMGWQGGHLHVFSTGWEDYGRLDPELGHADEAAVRLGELLRAPRDTLRYTYDWGQTGSMTSCWSRCYRRTRKHPSVLPGR